MAGLDLGDIRSVRLLWLKGGLFVVCGLIASGLLALEGVSAQALVLHALAVWCFARAYYFAFYVVEHYADPGFRYAGLIDFLQYAWRKAREGQKGPQG